jgi:peptide-methionine (S)-S-oxide reductase
MFDKQIIITEEKALPGRENPIVQLEPHFINQTDLATEPKQGSEVILLGLGCFWGAERLFWKTAGVISTSVGYSGGYTPNPTYEEVCSGQTGHAEVVRVVFDPTEITLDKLLPIFWESHNPTQGMRQGNDQGTQYRSVIYTYSEAQYTTAINSRQAYQALLDKAKGGVITTQIQSAKAYYFAENYHQQYLAKNPNGYCGIGGTGVCFPPEK